MFLAILGILFLAQIVLLFTSSLASILTNCHSYKYYKKIYKTLPLMNYKRNDTQVYGFIEGEEEKFTWFLIDNAFCLTAGHYLHNASFTWADPYSAYWMLKYRRYFSKINIYELENY